MKLSAIPEYHVWAAMHRRCTNPLSDDYARYGGRGIRVCERWLDFEVFLADVGRRPTKQHSIDRYPNNDGNYEPGNVRWATPIEQANNKRTSRLVEYQDKIMTIAEAARAAGKGISRETARCRMLNGWSVKDAVETPLLFRRSHDMRKIREVRND